MAVSEKLRKKLEKKKNELKTGGGLGYKTFKEGTSLIRILSLGVDEDFAIEVTRFYAGKELGGIVSQCTIGGESPLLEKYKEVKNSDNEEDAELAELLKPKKGYFVVCVEVSEKNTVVGEPQLALISKGVYEELIDLMLDEDNGDFTDPKNGYVIKIKRTGSGQFDTEYKVLKGKILKVDKKLAAPQDGEKFIKTICATYEEEEQYLAAVLGDVGSSSKKGKKKSDKKSSKKGASDIGDDDPKPKKGAKKKKSKK